MATACMVDGVLSGVQFNGEYAPADRSVAVSDLGDTLELSFGFSSPIRLDDEEEEFEDEDADEEFDDEEEDIDDEEFEEEEDLDEFEDDDLDEFDDEELDEDLDEDVEDEADY